MGAAAYFAAPRPFMVKKEGLYFMASFVLTNLCPIQVSWFRKEDGILKVLTIGKETFIADQRFSSAFKSPKDWRLRIKPTNPRDNGTYLCQISTHPPTLLVTHLQVIGE